MLEGVRDTAGRSGLGAPLAAWLALVTLADGWTAFRAGQGIWDSATHGTFLKPGGGIYLAYPTTMPLVVLTVASAVSLAGLLLLRLRRFAGLWLFLTAQVAGTGALLVRTGRISPLALIGLASMALLALLVLRRREVFR